FQPNSSPSPNPITLLLYYCYHYYCIVLTLTLTLLLILRLPLLSLCTHPDPNPMAVLLPHYYCFVLTLTLTLKNQLMYPQLPMQSDLFLQRRFLCGLDQLVHLFNVLYRYRCNRTTNHRFNFNFNPFTSSVELRCRQLELALESSEAKALSAAAQSSRLERMLGDARAERQLWEEKRRQQVKTTNAFQATLTPGLTLTLSGEAPPAGEDRRRLPDCLGHGAPRRWWCPSPPGPSYQLPGPKSSSTYASTPGLCPREATTPITATGRGEGDRHRWGCGRGGNRLEVWPSWRWRSRERRAQLRAKAGAGAG
ncbi:unnamed protein product, partial [Discosporangium mesarthrocarpum]